MTNREAVIFLYGVVAGAAMIGAIHGLLNWASERGPENCVSALDGPFGKQVACPYVKRK